MNRLLPILFAFVYLSKSAYAQSNGSATFICDFETDTCGLVNDDHHAAKWVRKFMHLERRRKGNAMVLETDGEVKQMGRLLTPFINREVSGERGCLTYDLFMTGDGVNAFSVKVVEDSGVRTHITLTHKNKEWIKYVHRIAPGGDYIRFVFEADVDPNLGETVLALDNISFKPGECRRPYFP